MLSQLIQRQVPIGSKAAFSLKSGREISGILVELGRDHITLECDSGSTTVLIEMIGAWQVTEEPPAPVEEISLVLDRRTISDLSSTDLTPPAHLVSSPPSEFSEPEVMKKLFEIEARFQAQLQVAVDDAISDQDALKVLIAIAVNSQTGACSRHNIICETDVTLNFRQKQFLPLISFSINITWVCLLSRIYKITLLVYLRSV